MAVRRRLRGEITKGYPFPRFIRYCKRFGQVYAAFDSPKMQWMRGNAEPIKGPGPVALLYWNKPAVREELDLAVDQGLGHYAEALQTVLEGFPVHADVQSLPRGAYTD